VRKATFLVLLCLGVVSPTLGVTFARPAGDAEARHLVEAAFAAPAAERGKALEALDALGPLAWADVEGWRKVLVGLQAKGPKAGAKARNFLYAKAERGLYLLGGKAGKGGLLLALHGGGAGAGDAGQAASAFGGAASALQMLMAAPEVLEKTERGWTDPPSTEHFVIELLEALVRTNRIDPNRVVLTGHSMGGYGTWTIGAVHADRFAGLAAFAGAPTCARPAEGAPLADVEDGILPNLRNVPLFVYQSLDDRNVPAESNELATKELDRLAKEDPGGYLHTYERVDGRAHGFPEKGPGPGIEWAAKRPRDPRPKKIVWQPSRAWKHAFYWLWWERPTLGTVVTVESKGDNRFDVAATGPIVGLELLIDPRLVDVTKEVVVNVGGKEVWRGVPVPSLRTLVETAVERADAEYVFAGKVPTAPAAPR